MHLSRNRVTLGDFSDLRLQLGRGNSRTSKGRFARIAGRILALVCLIACASFVVVGEAKAQGSNKVPGVYNTSGDKNYEKFLGSWIWTSRLYDRQTCHLWRTFDIPDSSAVKQALIRMTVDNEYVLFLDGRELGRGAEWRELFDYDVTPLLTSGRHVLAVNAFNSSGYAGMLFGMRIELADGRTIEIKSDQTWRIAPDDLGGWQKKTIAPASWPAATIIAPFGSNPWWTKPDNVNTTPPLEPIRVYFWQTTWFQITLLIVCGLVILFSIWLMAQLALHRKERWMLQQERARIARDIHDDLGSRMTQLVLNGEVAQNELPSNSDTRAQIDRICEEAREVLASMDEILWAVNPRQDTLTDFASYVCGYAQEFLKPSGIQCLLEVDPEMTASAFDLPLRRTLLMAVKETLNNAVKYSGATELLLQVRCQGERLVVVVQDNGKGFDAKKIKPGRNGLANMLQRMNDLGGTCQVTSEPGKGCRVEFGVPLRYSRRSSWKWIWKSRRVPAAVARGKGRGMNEAQQVS